MILAIALTMSLVALAVFRGPIADAIAERAPDCPPILTRLFFSEKVQARAVKRTAAGLMLGLVTLAGFIVLAFIDHRLGLGGFTSFAALYTVEQLPKTSQEAIREFNERYIAGTAQAPVSTWANRLGDVVDVGSPLTTFPTSILSLKFEENKGENRFKSLGEQGFDLKSVEFDEGVEAKVLDLKTNSFAYRKWTDAADRLRISEQRHVQRRVALDILEANAKCGWDALALFHDAHLVNPRDTGLGTFDNLQGSAKDVVSITNIETELTLMMDQVLDESGERLIQEPDWAIIVPPAKYLPLVDLLKQDIIARAVTNLAGSENVAAAGVTNPFKGLIEVVNAPQLTDVNDWYIVEKSLLGAFMPPWLAARYDAGPELSLRVYDESTDYFRNTGKIAMSNHIWYGFAAVFPHAIRKVVGA